MSFRGAKRRGDFCTGPLSGPINFTSRLRREAVLGFGSENFRPPGRAAASEPARCAGQSTFLTDSEHQDGSALVERLPSVPKTC